MLEDFQKVIVMSNRVLSDDVKVGDEALRILEETCKATIVFEPMPKPEDVPLEKYVVAAESTVPIANKGMEKFDKKYK